MSRLTQAVSVPRAVMLGGKPYLASELRVYDLALLTAYVEDRCPCPYDEAEPLLIAQKSGREWKQLLGDTLDAQEEWAPDLSTDEADEILFSREGMGYFGWVVLRRGHPEMTLRDATTVMERASALEIRKFSRVAWAIDPITIIASIVDGPKADRGEGDGRDWLAIRYVYERNTRCGPPFEELTLTQLYGFLNGGKLPKPGHVSAPADQFDWELQRRRNEFWAEIDPPVDEAETTPAPATEGGE